MADSFGQQAYNKAQSVLGAPYVYGATGPDSFDCSGLMQWAYKNGPGIDVGRTTDAQWNNSTTLTTVFDAISAQAGGETTAFGTGELQVGDLLLYFVPGNSGENAHVKMYAGNNQTIEAPHTGAVVTMNPLDLVGSSNEPFRGVKRPTGEGKTGDGGSSDSTQGSGSTGGSSSSSPLDAAATDSLALYDLPDPRDNRPFSPFFMGQGIPTGGQGTSSDGRGGTLALPLPGVSGLVNTTTSVVRGGIVELLSNTSSGSNVTLQGRPRGQFACYFMMNPESISFDAVMNADLSPPSQTNAKSIQQVTAFLQQQTISFSLVFNRMYEVWQGTYGGPSDIGCRWDIRSIERLMGMYDAQSDLLPGTQTPGNMGLGNYGAGARPPMSLPVQVVIGGPNSIQFQGFISTMTYTYNLFDSRMIPIQASVDLTLVRMYTAQLAGGNGAPDIVSMMVTQMGQLGSPYYPNLDAKFNNQTGLINASPPLVIPRQPGAPS